MRFANIAVVMANVCVVTLAAAQSTPSATLQITAFNLPTELAPSPAALVNERIRIRIFYPNFVGGQVQRTASDRLQEQLNRNGNRVAIIDTVFTTNASGEGTISVPIPTGQTSALIIVELQREDSSNQTTQRIDGLIVAPSVTSRLKTSVPEALSGCYPRYADCMPMQIRCRAQRLRCW